MEQVVEPSSPEACVYPHTDATMRLQDIKDSHVMQRIANALPVAVCTNFLEDVQQRQAEGWFHCMSVANVAERLLQEGPGEYHACGIDALLHDMVQFLSQGKGIIVARMSDDAPHFFNDITERFEKAVCANAYARVYPLLCKKFPGESLEATADVKADYYIAEVAYAATCGCHEPPSLVCLSEAHCRERLLFALPREPLKRFIIIKGQLKVGGMDSVEAVERACPLVRKEFLEEFFATSNAVGSEELMLVRERTMDEIMTMHIVANLPDVVQQYWEGIFDKYMEDGVTVYKTVTRALAETADRYPIEHDIVVCKLHMVLVLADEYFERHLAKKLEKEERQRHANVSAYVEQQQAKNRRRQAVEEAEEEAPAEEKRKRDARSATKKENRRKAAAAAAAAPTVAQPQPAALPAVEPDEDPLVAEVARQNLDAHQQKLLHKEEVAKTITLAGKRCTPI